MSVSWDAVMAVVAALIVPVAALATHLVQCKGKKKETVRLDSARSGPPISTAGGLPKPEEKKPEEKKMEEKKPEEKKTEEKKPEEAKKEEKPEEKKTEEKKEASKKEEKKSEKKDEKAPEADKKEEKKDDPKSKEKAPSKVASKVEEKKEEEKKEEEKKSEEKKEEEKKEEEKKEASKKEEKKSEKKEGSKKEDSKKEKKEASKKETSKKEGSKKEQSKKEKSKKEQQSKKEKKAPPPPPCEVKMEPAALKFAPTGGTMKVKVANPTGKRLAFKVRCSDNVLYRVNPVFGFVEPGKSVELEVIRVKGAPKPDKIRIVHATASPEDKNAQALFKNEAALPTGLLPLSIS